MIAAALFSAAADALAKEDDDAAEVLLTQAADAVTDDYPQAAAGARLVRDQIQSCDLIRRRRAAAIVDFREWAAALTEPEES